MSSLSSTLKPIILCSNKNQGERPVVIPGRSIDKTSLSMKIPDKWHAIQQTYKYIVTENGIMISGWRIQAFSLYIVHDGQLLCSFGSLIHYKSCFYLT